MSIMPIDYIALEKIKSKGYKTKEIFFTGWWKPETYESKEFAEAYDCQDICWDMWAKDCVDKADIKEIDVVADLGCGTGVATKRILAKNPKLVYAVEPSKAMLEVFSRKIKDEKVNQVIGSIDELANKNFKANKIISHRVLIVVNDPQQFLDKVYAYLPKGGRYVFTIEDWRKTIDGVTWQDFEIEIADKIYEKTRQKIVVPLIGKPKYYERAQVEELILKAGGKIISHTQKSRVVDGWQAFNFCHDDLFLDSTGKLFDSVEQMYENKNLNDTVQHLFVTEKI